MNAKQALPLASLLLAAQDAAASACVDAVAATVAANIATMLTTIGNACAYFMMVYMGMKWMMAEDPEGRENARRGVIYIVIGLILLRSSSPLVLYLLC